RLAGQAQEQAVAVHGRTQGQDIGAWGAGVEDGAGEPAPGAVAAADTGDVVLVFGVVDDDQGGSLLPVAAAADLAAGAQGFDDDAVAQADTVLTPDWATAAGL